MPKEKEKEWLNPDLTEPKPILSMLKPYPPNKMDYWRVPDEVKNPKDEVKNPKKDYLEVIEHYQSSKQAPLLN